MTGPLDERAALALLARPPAPPRDPGLFSADSEAGPGIYPQGPPMRPAAGPAWDADRARAALAEILPGAGERTRALAAFDAPALASRLPDPGVRAGLVALTGTAGEPLVAEAAAGRTPVVRYGALEQASRVVGPDPGGDAGLRLVNERYRAEHPALLAGSLLHALLAGEPPRGHPQEALLHGLLAAVHLQQLARAPALARLGTELARRQSSLALSLLNSRPAGSPRISLIAPDGPGTIPGGAPRMQTPDFWSIPFAPAEPRSAPAPEALRPVLRRLLGSGAPLDGPLSYDEGLARLVDEHLGSCWLSPMQVVRAGVALEVL